jgi:hypothetical protein
MRARVMAAAVRDVIQRLGLAGVCAFVLLLLAAAGALLVAPRLAASNRALAGEIAQLSQPAAAGSAAERSRPHYDAADPAAALLDQLPAADRFAPFVDALQAEASHRGVVIDRTEYRIQPVLGGRALRTQLILPARGDYPRIRGWLEGVLHDYPSASLQELALHRATDGAAMLEARVVIAFYTRSAH